MTKYTKPNDTKSCKNLKDLKDYLEQNEPLSTGNCNSRFSNLLLYPPECYELLKEAEKPNAPADQNPGRLDVQKELQNGVTGAAEEEQSERSIGVRSPEIDAPEIVVPGDRRAMEASDPLNHTQLDVGDSNGDTPNNNTKIPVGTILYTSLGSVLPLVTLYRLTPLGSWVNTKILGKNKLMDNMKKNHYELLLNDVRNGEMNLNDAGNHEASLNDPIYHIRYNSATNH
ncbi:VIR protein [Plasmodium vivax]|uniref:VIR protein n=1 Tax=Plasmodium vivax TaxID=5855 RepID=A0A1G4EC83_PLAVI|nr:VIR protein [Plasmodium vivax]